MKKRTPDCKIVRRKGRLFVINKKNPKYKTPQGNSFTAEEAIDPGKAVERGTNPAEQVKVCTAAEKTLGIAVHIHAEPGEAYAKDKRVAVMTFGDIAVTAGGDVVAGKAAEMNASGKFVASTKATGLTFMTSGAADDVVIVRVRK